MKDVLIKIDELMDKHDYPFRNREDFVESRFDWDSLADAANDFYYLLLTIKDKLNNERN